MSLPLIDPLVDPPPTDQAAPRVHTMEVRDVHKSFGPYDILTGLNLDFVDDAITTILGPSGTGKSVLIKHLVGLLRPDQRRGADLRPRHLVASPSRSATTCASASASCSRTVRCSGR